MQLKSSPVVHPYSPREQTKTLLRHGVNPASNVDFRKYEMPVFDNAIFLVAVRYDRYWLYTTGESWVQTRLLEVARTTKDYSRNGCYYSTFRDSYSVMHDLPIDYSKIRWEVFFDLIKSIE